MHVEACAYATHACNTYAMHAFAWNVHMLVKCSLKSKFGIYAVSKWLSMIIHAYAHAACIPYVSYALFLNF